MLTHSVFIFAVIILSIGLFIMLTSDNYLRKIIGLGIFQNAVLILFISAGKIEGGIAPILTGDQDRYSSPLPHVLMLTAIVVGFATLAVGLALIKRIYEEFGTISEEEIEGAQR